MALVLYQGDQGNNQSGGAGGQVGFGRQDFSDVPTEAQNIQSTLESLQSKERKKKYIGLANQGGTCYMNSLLQSLYMTPEFRQFIYSFNYNSDLHGNKDYCIPFQLQRLFANLQLSRSNYVQTRSLTKSFGWESNMSFEQHDIQEFCRVLFDAIEQSFAIVGQECNMINTMYQGESQSYTKCRECGYESAHKDRFLDLSLPIKNEFGTGVLNSSLEMALENYIKPELLNESNQYFCEDCNKKVDADRGMKLTKLPPLFDIQLSRFTLDWNTFQRIKIYDSVSFPFYLNMNDYMKGYEGIENKVYQKEVERMQQFAKAQIEKNQEQELQKRQKLDKPQNQQNEQSSNHDSVENSERDQMAQEDKTAENVEMKDQSTNEEAKEHKKLEKGVKINVQMNQDQSNNDQPVVTDEDYEDNPYLYATGGPKKKIDYTKPEGDDDGFNSYDAAQYDSQFDGDNYKVKHKNEKFALFPKQQQVILQQTEEEKELAQALEQIRDLEEKERLTLDTDNQLLEFLKQGDFVYELYSVLIHSGSAMGGHYYCYIKSTDDGKWYNFNDTSVSEIQQDEVLKTFGDKFGSGGGTAYLLKYRKYNPNDIENPLIVDDSIIPSYLRSEIDEETEKLIKEQMDIEERVMSLKLKIYHNDEVKTLTVRKNETLKDTCLKIMEEFKITDVDFKNFRLRAYDAMLKAKLQVYDQFDQQLHKLNFQNFITLLVELKTEDQEFEAYDPNNHYFRVLKFVEDVHYDFSKQDTLPTQLIVVNKKQETVADLDKRLSEMFDIPVERLVIFLRHENIYNNTVRTELYNIDWRKKMTIENGAKLDHGCIMYVEEGDPKQKLDDFNWHKEFVKDQEQLKILFHDPINDPDANVFSFQIFMKKSNTLLELKQRISELIGLSTSEFVLKKYRQQREFKNLNSTLVQLGLQSGSLVKVEKGKPHQDGLFELSILDIQLLDDAPTDDTIFVKNPLFKLSIEPDATVLELKQRVIQKYNEQFPDSPITLESFRLRNPKIDDLGDVMQNDEHLESFYLYDDKEIFLQKIVPERNFSCFNELMPTNVYHLLVREWNPETWLFGPIYELKIDKSIHASKLSKFLSEQVFPHIPNETLFCSKVNNIKQFKRADLALKKWNRLMHQTVWLGQSTLEINRDSVYIIVKDNEIKIRDNLTEEEVKKYATNQYLDHIAKKHSKEVDFQHRDALFDASQAVKPDYTKNRRAEKGIKITVGGPQPKPQEVQPEQSSKDDSQKKDEKKPAAQNNQQEEDMETDEDGGGVFIEALF
ncbi:ubiquitin carboxyl-terminal hydrolase family protein [Stylonychia lemnae]|uniref:Ubiquitin carboxyl-terminal hydrolase family protein n=1 Tax=Stylonychia lemnae TaxID=5949 RepID=A0A078ANG2_STYLE|nr:ubiquitin carboxyl-terminal hydrolase family protein [Stylonychia lemnae]|eukprot:CDW83714.1 ubiquitin carboxyl-terminal hydrolase family protein [Stylonychia lemnae]